MARTVLILSMTFPPDGVSTAHLMGDLAEDLVERGYTVTVLTTKPHYNVDEAAEVSQPIRPVLGGLLGRSDYKGASVYHTFILQKSANRAKRVLGWAIFHLISTIAGFLLRLKTDVILTPSPPLTMGVGAWLLGLRYRAPVVYLVQELYPDVVVRLGLIKGRSVISVLEALEGFVYRRVTRVTAITPGIRHAILDKGVPSGKVLHIPNWVDIEMLSPGPKINAFSKVHGLRDLFVVSYAGNFGPAQSFDELIDAAQLLREHDNIRFLLVGGGIDKDRIARNVQDLPNVQVLPHQPYEHMPHVYATSDLSYVPLRDGLGAAAMPSKVYKVMASGTPVLALAARNSDLADLVMTANCGFVINPGSASELAHAIHEAYRDKERTAIMGENARRYVEERFSRPVVIDQYVALVESLK